MGLIDTIVGLVFGSDRNVIKETAAIFRENAEASADRQHDMQTEALKQFATEFSKKERSVFDQIMDGVNRLPRPAMALGTLGLFVAAMVDPIWFASRMQGVALVPEPLWWLLGAVVSFYFGARHQMKGQEFQRSMAQSLAHVPTVVENTKALQKLETEAEDPQTDQVAEQTVEVPRKPVTAFKDNAALRDWAATRN